jgi:formate dehydrogenase major subunit
VSDDRYSLGWGFAWPANRRVLYNRASADPDGRPWSERKKLVWWDQAEGRWTGYDIPDFPVKKAPNTPAKPDGTGMDALSGADPFIMMGDGKGWLFAPGGLRDGPLPTHYEPMESPVVNALYRQDANPSAKYWPKQGTASPSCRIRPTLCGDHLSPHRAPHRWRHEPLDSWLAELQPTFLPR